MVEDPVLFSNYEHGRPSAYSWDFMDAWHVAQYRGSVESHQDLFNGVLAFPLHFLFDYVPSLFISPKPGVPGPTYTCGLGLGCGQNRRWVATMRVCVSILSGLMALLCVMRPAPATQEPATVEIRVRILRAWDGKPWKRVRVTLVGDRSAAPGGLKTRDIVFQLRAKTGPNGVAHFLVETPLPPRLVVDAPVYGCGVR